MSVVEGKFNGRPRLILNEDATLKEIIISFNNLVNRLEEVMKIIRTELTDNSSTIYDVCRNIRFEVWDAFHDLLSTNPSGLKKCKCISCNIGRKLSVE